MLKLCNLVTNCDSDVLTIIQNKYPFINVCDYKEKYNTFLPTIVFGTKLARKLNSTLFIRNDAECPNVEVLFELEEELKEILDSYFKACNSIYLRPLDYYDNDQFLAAVDNLIFDNSLVLLYEDDLFLYICGYVGRDFVVCHISLYELLMTNIKPRVIIEIITKNHQLTLDVFTFIESVILKKLNLSNISKMLLSAPTYQTLYYIQSWYDELFDSINISELIKSYERYKASNNAIKYLNSRNILVDDGYITCTYKQNNTTFRTSIHDSTINFMTLPDSEIQKIVKSRFGKDGCLVSIDQKSQEFTILLKFLDIDTEAYFDIHADASAILGITRSNAKTLNYASLYGKSNTSIAGWLASIDPIKIEQYRKYLQPIIEKEKSWSKKIDENSKTLGYNINLLGRKIRTPSDHKGKIYMIQSSASDIMIDIILSIKEILTNYKSTLLFHKHDCLFFDMHKDELTGLLPQLTKCMKYQQHGVIFNIVTKVDGEVYTS